VVVCVCAGDYMCCGPDVDRLHDRPPIFDLRTSMSICPFWGLGVFSLLSWWGVPMYKKGVLCEVTKNRETIKSENLVFPRSKQMRIKRIK